MKPSDDSIPYWPTFFDALTPEQQAERAAHFRPRWAARLEVCRVIAAGGSYAEDALRTLVAQRLERREFTLATNPKHGDPLLRAIENTRHYAASVAKRHEDCDHEECRP